MNNEILTAVDGLFAIMTIYFACTVVIITVWSALIIRK